MVVTWQELLDNATSEDKVVEIIREFLESLGPGEIGMLPETCKPRRIFDGRDVRLYALTLSRYQSAPFAPSGALLARTAAVMIHAEMRITQITTRVNDKDADLQGSA